MSCPFRSAARRASKATRFGWSGAISNDKLTVFADNAWRAFDVFYDYGVANQPTQVIFYEVFPPNPIADGISD